MLNGKLCRPAQDCSKRYGYAIVIEEITTLDTDEYAETEVARIDPDWLDGLVGTHTFNCDGDLEVIDGLLKTSAWAGTNKRNPWPTQDQQPTSL